MIAATRTGRGAIRFSIAGEDRGPGGDGPEPVRADITVLYRSVPVVIWPGFQAMTADFVRGQPPGQPGITAPDECTGTPTWPSGRHADSPDSGERFEGFCEALRQAGLPVPGGPTAGGGFAEAAARAAVAALLADGPAAPRPSSRRRRDGDRGADRAAGRRLASRRITVTRFDDIAAAHHVRPGLTTVRQTMRELGEQSVRMLSAGSPTRPRPAVRGAATRTMIRRSSGCPPAPPGTRRPGKA